MWSAVVGAVNCGKLFAIPLTRRAVAAYNPGNSNLTAGAPR